jgi:hypothetical protein
MNYNNRMAALSIILKDQQRLRKDILREYAAALDIEVKK